MRLHFTAGKPGLQTIELGPVPQLQATEILAVWSTASANLVFLTFRRERASAVLKPYAGTIPRDRWLICQAEDRLPSSKGSITERGGYLDNATVLYGFGKEPSQADWTVEVPHPSGNCA